jgi:glucoamylase
LDWRVVWARAGIALGVLALVAGVAVSGGASVDPAVPRGFPGVVPAFLAKTMGERAGGADHRGYEARTADAQDRRWLARARALGPGAPRWARAMYRRSLLVLRASVDRHGAAVAGARAGWAYVWPRDAGAVAIALASAGYQAEARRIARFLLGLDLGAAARFERSGEPVEGRGAQGDEAGWTTAAAKAVGIRARAGSADSAVTQAEGARTWRDRADYQEGDAGDYLGNALAAAFAAPKDAPERRRRAGAIVRSFGTPRGLARVADDPGSGLDTAAAWAVRPFALPGLYPIARRTLLRLVAERRTRFGLLPSESWHGGDDPWTAPTAWCAWSLAALWRIDRRAGRPREAAADRRAALSLMADLRRASTRRGLLPERIDERTGAPASTTPLAWSHAFAILAIRTLWP